MESVILRRMVVRPATHLRLMPGDATLPDSPELVDSYRRLADLFHEVLAEQSLDALLVRIADALARPDPARHAHDLRDRRGARGPHAGARTRPVGRRDHAHDPQLRRGDHRLGREPARAGARATRRISTLASASSRARRTSPEALISIPLVARAQIKGVLNIYRVGEEGVFSEAEFELAKRFADAAALALDNAQIRARLEHQAQTDSLTGLFNHRSFHERLLIALQGASRTHRPVAVLMLDIDDFKRVNDVHGHGVGDELLRLLAEALRSCVRPDDIVCRLGGEEFGVIMHACDGHSASTVAERLIDRLAELDLAGVGTLTVSVGLALGPEHAMNPRELAACAEAAMMTAKAHGKNRVVLYDEEATDRPGAPLRERDVRSIAHMKMLQSLSGKLNRLNDVREIGDEIAAELRSLIDYHNCRVFVVDGDELDAGRVPRRVRRRDGSRCRSSCSASRSARGSPAVAPSSPSRSSSATPRTASSGRGFRVRRRSRSRSLAVPLRYGSRVVGVIVISKLGLDQFDEDDVRLLEVLAGHAAVAVENASLYESARREAESATTLLEFGRALATTSSLDEIYERIVGLTADLIGSPRTSIWIADDDGSFTVRKAFGYSEAQMLHVEERRFRISDLRADAGERLEPFVVDPATFARIEPAAFDPTASYAIAPLVVDERGGCIVGRDTRGRLRGARASHSSAASPTRRGSRSRTPRTTRASSGRFVSTVEALANALEANDEYTSSHARWITDLSLRVGRELGLGERDLKRLELGALLHDIGKIGIPSAILSKPGRLTADERAVMETHPELGERIIAPIDRLQEVGAIVRHCHERWDGCGYPDGLRAETIPLESRIIFVCDAYHAMTTDRPYRKRLSHPEAVRRLREGAGSQFDGDVVEVALAVIDQRPS